MFVYYVSCALRSVRRHKVLAALMVLAIAVGIGAAMTTLTVYHVLSGDPLPGRSDRIFYVRVDPRPMDGYSAGVEPESQMTRFDAETLLREARGQRQAFMTAGNVAVEPERDGVVPFYANARFTTADFFPMFRAPFLHGSAWDASADAERARVAVVSRSFSEKVFGRADSVGQTLRAQGHVVRVIGVLDDWRLTPRFYDLTTSRYGDVEDVFVPFSTARELDMPTEGNMNCWGERDDPEGEHGLNASCAWLQYWVELASPGDAADYRAYLDRYSEAQRAAGRFQRPPNVRLQDVMGWLDHNGVVPSDVRLQSWLAFGFLAACLLNTVGLLLAIFLRRSAEIGVRRALGATRRAIFTQCLIESGAIGLVGGALGLGLALLGLWAVRQQPTEYAHLAHIDGAMLATTFVLALAASLVAGLFPAWRACQVTPAMQLKSQ